MFQVLQVRSLSFGEAQTAANSVSLEMINMSLHRAVWTVAVHW